MSSVLRLLTTVVLPVVLILADNPETPEQATESSCIVECQSDLEPLQTALGVVTKDYNELRQSVDKELQTQRDEFQSQIRGLESLIKESQSSLEAQLTGQASGLQEQAAQVKETSASERAAISQQLSSQFERDLQHAAQTLRNEFQQSFEQLYNEFRAFQGEKSGAAERLDTTRDELLSKLDSMESELRSMVGSAQQTMDADLRILANTVGTKDESMDDASLRSLVSEMSATMDADLRSLVGTVSATMSDTTDKNNDDFSKIKKDILALKSERPVFSEKDKRNWETRLYRLEKGLHTMRLQVHLLENSTWTATVDSYARSAVKELPKYGERAQEYAKETYSMVADPAFWTWYTTWAYHNYFYCKQYFLEWVMPAVQIQATYQAHHVAQIAKDLYALLDTQQKYVILLSTGKSFKPSQRLYIAELIEYMPRKHHKPIMDVLFGFGYLLLFIIWWNIFLCFSACLCPRMPPKLAQVSDSGMASPVRRAAPRTTPQQNRQPQQQQPQRQQQQRQQQQQKSGKNRNKHKRSQSAAHPQKK